jgi:hypothetical protein
MKTKKQHSIFETKAYSIKYTNGTITTEHLTDRQHKGIKNRKNYGKIIDVICLGKSEENL